MLKRAFLFVATNLAVLLVLGIVMAILQATGVLGRLGTNTYLPLFVFAAVFGFGGAFISLALSKRIAKWSTGAVVIEQPGSAEEAWLLETVGRLASQAGVAAPEVAIYQSPEMNAFATGMRRDASLVAVSSGLLRAMNREEVEAVLGHELSHVANGDMVTMTLLQGVLNTFVLFFSRIIGSMVDSALSGDRGDRRGYGIGYLLTTIVAQIVLGVLASVIVMAFSRHREYRADAGSAGLVGAPKMIAALRRLGGEEVPSQLPEPLHAFGIRDSGGGLLASLFRSHPPLEDRIEALQRMS